MTQHWRKLQRIFCADGQRPWMMSHASCPQAQQIEGSLYRVWFAPRDALNRTYCSWIEIDLEKPGEALRIADEPTVGPGDLGTFDESGAMFSWIMETDSETRIYYTGWTVGDTVPFRNAIGMVSTLAGSDGAFIKGSLGPVLDRSPADPFFVGNPCVMRVGDVWHLWYLSGTGWSAETPAHAAYDIRHAISADGVSWAPDPGVAIAFEHSGEMAIARPAVTYDEGRFRMWYSYRGEGWPYRIGYAESEDGTGWTRCDDEVLGLEPSAEGWDSEMTAYPHVFKHDGQPYMLYCGNGFSRGGMGLAVLDG